MRNRFVKLAISIFEKQHSSYFYHADCYSSGQPAIPVNGIFRFPKPDAFWETIAYIMNRRRCKKYDNCYLLYSDMVAGAAKSFFKWLTIPLLPGV